MAGPIRDYRDLDAWKQAIELALACESVCERLPRQFAYLALQIRRAADSVHSNIAEGNGRPSTADYLRHLGISTASLNEVGSRLYFVRRRFDGRIDTSAAEKLTLTTARLLAGLVRSLRRKRERG